MRSTAPSHLAALSLLIPAALVLGACTTASSTASRSPTASPVAAAASGPVPLAPWEAGFDPSVPLTGEMQAALTPAQALARLQEGNARFLRGIPVSRDYLAQVHSTSGGQYPMATVLGCIDSRVPPEIVFDKGVGDIFTARIAGNFVETDVLGSLEYASAVAGARLIVVLGHTECGAVKGACDRVEMGNLTATLAHLMPAIASVRDVSGPRTSSNHAFVDAVAHAHVDLTVRKIVRDSPILRDLVAQGKLTVIGAIHDVSTGRVTFRDETAITQQSLATLGN